MEVNVQRTNSQRSQNNDNCNGPRVSFNKDVHVKRIGTRANEFANAGGHTQLKRKLPQELTEAELLKEAALVLAQAERVKCTANDGFDTSDKGDAKFNSLPYRKKKTKPLNRSVSDASQKKLKKPSIFNLFSKRSDPNLTQIGEHDSRGQPLSVKPAIVGGRAGGVNADAAVAGSGAKDSAVSKLVRRSKSDVGYNNISNSNNNNNNNTNSVKNAKTLIIDRKQINQLDNDDTAKYKKKSQLSPIIENQLQEKYFGYSPSEHRSQPQSPIGSGAVGHRQREVRSEEREPDESVHAHWPSIRPYNSQDSVDFPARTAPPAIGISTRPLGFSSLDSLQLHSSQLPPQKLPLTRGLAVDDMVKRLSMERFSPPPQINSPAFSYIRPNEPITYAQVRRDEDNARPMQQHQSAKPERISLAGTDGVDFGSRPFTGAPTRHAVRSPTLPSQRNYAPPTTAPSTANITPNHPYSDDDEGLGGMEVLNRRPYHRHISVEPPIVPKIQATTFDESPHLQDLSNRRRLLESKFQSRAFSQPPAARERTIPVERSERQSTEQRFDTPDRTTTARLPATSTPRRQWFQPAKDHGIDYNRDNLLDASYDSHFDPSPRVREHVLKHPIHIQDNIDHPANVAAGSTGRHHNKSQNYWTDFNGQQRSYHDDHEPYRQPLRVNRDQQQQPFASTLERGDKYKYRSFDKGDSGIENDLKRDCEFSRDIDRFHNNEPDKNITALFLKRERQHTELMHPSKKRYDYIFRERSIDDGSHYDPRLDKYPRESSSSSTLRRLQAANKVEQNNRKNEKKFGSLKKVKELFLPSAKKKRSILKEDKDASMISSEKLHERYKEHHGNGGQPMNDRTDGTTPTITDIASRRRLSTPKASPVPKRTPSQKSSKVSSYQTSAASSTSTAGQKSGWFMSLDRLPRKKSIKSDKTADVNKWATTTAAQKRSTSGGKSRALSPPSSSSRPTLRFFGDTDAESTGTASISKATGKHYRPSLAKPFYGNSHLSHSVYDLDVPVTTKSTMSNGKLRSTSMQQLSQHPTIHEESSQHHHHRHRSEHPLHDISPSTSENEQTAAVRISHGLSEPKWKQRRQYHSTDQLQSARHHTSNGHQRADGVAANHDTYYHPLRENHDRHSRSVVRKPPPGPQKPARSIDRRRAFSMDRDRLMHDSSGTDGDSSQSVVYLHATTVGNIPQPNTLGSRRSNSRSRDELSSIKYQTSPQPMKHTVSRSVSMMAPWTPRHKRDGYEIEYSQTFDNNNKKKTSNGGDLKPNQNQHKHRTRSRDDLVSAAKLRSHSSSNRPMR